MGMNYLAESVAGSMSTNRRIIGNHNICPKHKNNYINYCLSHAEPLCAECFEDHRGPQHDIQMLQNFAKKQVKKVKDDVDYIENSLRHIKEKLELRRNLNEKKAIAAKQFFELTRRELDRIEREFWEKHNKEQDDEQDIVAKIHEQQKKLEEKHREVLPTYLRMEQQIYDSEFMDIINSEKNVFQMNKNFEPYKNEF